MNTSLQSPVHDTATDYGFIVCLGQRVRADEIAVNDEVARRLANVLPPKVGTVQEPQEVAA